MSEDSGSLSRSTTGDITGDESSSEEGNVSDDQENSASDDGSGFKALTVSAGLLSVPRMTKSL